MRQYGATDQLAPTQMGGAKIITAQFGDTAIVGIVAANAPRKPQYGEGDQTPAQSTVSSHAAAPGSEKRPPIEQQQQQQYINHDLERIKQIQQQQQQLQM